jgi:hypothetical protein
LLLHSASSKQIRKWPFVTSVFHAERTKIESQSASACSAFALNG